MKNYRIYWFCELLSAFGTRLQSSAIMWFMYQDTGSVWILGSLTFIEALPALLFSLPIGNFLDKYKHKPIYLYSKLCCLALSLFMFFISKLNPSIFVWLLLLFLLDICEQVNSQANTTFTISIVSEDKRREVIRQNSFIKSIVKILGMSISGIIMAYTNISICFMLNAFSYVPFIFCYKVIASNRRISDSITKKKIKQKFKTWDAIKEVSHNAALSSSLCTLAVINFFCFTYNVIIPLIVTDLLGESSVMFGFILGINGLGNCLGNICMKYLPYKGKHTVLAVTLGMLLFLAGSSHNSFITLVIFFITGFVNNIFQVNATNEVQDFCSEETRDIYNGVYSFACSGFSPFAKLLLPVVINWLGIAGCLHLYGLIVIAISLGLCFYCKKVAVTNLKIK